MLPITSSQLSVQFDTALDKFLKFYPIPLACVYSTVSNELHIH